jgi:hypothetical protein
VSDTLEAMTTDELIDYFHGRLCLAIGKGDSRSVIGLMVMSLQKLGYDRGLKEGKRIAGKRP